MMLKGQKMPPLMRRSESWKYAWHDGNGRKLMATRGIIITTTTATIIIIITLT